MTLIAGFHSFGTPVLVGDFLTSITGRPSGVRKKILRITDNFVLGWTGHLIAAQSVLNCLQSSLGPDFVTLKSVRAILTDPATSNLGFGLEVMLICWVIDDEGQHCFLWNSSYPQELFLGAPQYAGSGESTIRALVGPQGLHHSTPPVHAGHQESTRGVLGVITQLLRNEMLGPSTREMGYGFAYEILQLKDGARFEYVDDILYFTIKCILDENGQYVRNEFGSSLYKYKSEGNCTAVSIFDPLARRQDIHVITPPGDYVGQSTQYLKQTMLSQKYTAPFKSDYYSIVVQFQAPGFVCPPVISIVPNDATESSGFFIDVSERNTLQLRPSKELLEWMYKTISEDLHKSSTQHAQS